MERCGGQGLWRGEKVMGSCSGSSGDVTKCDSPQGGVTGYKEGVLTDGEVWWSRCVER